MAAGGHMIQSESGSRHGTAIDSEYLKLKVPSMHIKTGQLSGETPSFRQRPYAVVSPDHKSVYSYSANVGVKKSFSRLYRLDVESMKWANLTPKIQRLEDQRATHSGTNLFFRYGPAIALSTFNGLHVLLVFGGERMNAPPCSDLLALNLDTGKWWPVEVSGGPVSPRMHPCAVVVGRRFYVFGGIKRDEGGLDDLLESFSVAEYDEDDRRWRWVVRDEPYPEDLPTLGFACDATPIHGGREIMLTIGCTNLNGGDAWEEINFSARGIISFNTTDHTFKVQSEARGDFPQSVTLYDLHNFPSMHEPPPPASTQASTSRRSSSRLQNQGHATPNLTSSAIICAWNTVPSDPELWLYTFSPNAECRSLNLQQKIADLPGHSMNIFVVVGSRLLLLGSRGTGNKYNAYMEIIKD